MLWGIKVSPSFSFLEVVIGCELQNNEPVMEIKNDGCGTEEKMVYLHLKKFFRGTRFTYLPFLKSIQSKYREGDHAYVSGKVKKMRMENHYEMREYNIDMLEEEEEQHAHVERRPYPLYPSKAGLKPDFLRDIISRGLKILTSNIDPMPNEILKEFNLLNLYDGDVGCGKTVVAFLACMEVIGSGFQGLQTGDIAMVIGTHSLIAEKVEFSALRIAVVDEQHRFGVIQRGRFNSKLYSVSAGVRMNRANSDESSEYKALMAPHVLAVSATPIPRTLALALYGDMSLTQITDLPPGRTPVETFVLEGNEIGFEKVFQMMREELITGGKVYLVYPVIEESEQLPQLRAVTADLASISEKFKGYHCGLLHGRLKSEEKDEALRKFRSGETRILLATQVIEIGVDVPDASMMVVMNAERFGVAQLHQLRGRVGRGARKSKCIFFSSTSGTLDRLKVLEKSSDGFYLANADLLLRGPGNLLGKKQSGHLPEFPVARLEVDGNILQEAHLAALVIIITFDLFLFIVVDKNKLIT
ncbi:putative ATP-dependent DNA helicase, chloroplastic [Cocos nucifera]|uniref:Putative ATP-dependent DNA helicase, chloroplastic n=1 Tax=Cocos nucifera TaxID=13894 RepID=A0A8K0N1P3_COCNU|nr:putative ATP-dependent DNA helicase, chloroplastic [Cocos nucifera]